MNADLNAYLEARFGWCSTLVGQSVVDRYLTQRATDLGSTDELLWRLRTSPEEERQLVEALRVPESWFGREPQTIAAALAALPPPGGEPLAVLSLACSRGEEPYSLAIALLEAGYRAFSIQAVDVSPGAIHEARAGCYQRIRGEVPLHFFEAEEDQFRIKAEVRERVQFHCYNALAAEFPPPDWHRKFHLVFCRNMLIYFERRRRGEVLDKIFDMLRPDGLLAVAASELPIPPAEKFAPTSGVFRKQTGVKASPQRRLGKKTLRLSMPPLPMTPPASRPDFLQLAEACADAGDFPAALKLCEQGLAADGPSVQVFYLQALVRQALGQTPEALASLRRALYLDPSHPEALRQLALLRQQTGDHEAAERLLRRARQGPHA